MATGYFLYGKVALAGLLAAVGVVAGYFIFRFWKDLDQPYGTNGSSESGVEA
jgi:hypothetical protein